MHSFPSGLSLLNEHKNLSGKTVGKNLAKSMAFIFYFCLELYLFHDSIMINYRGLEVDFNRK